MDSSCIVQGYFIDCSSKSLPNINNVEQILMQLKGNDLISKLKDYESLINNFITDLKKTLSQFV